MSFTVVAVVLCAAFFHAAWNAILKSRGDRLSSVTQMSMLLALLAAPVLLFVPLPNWECWPYLAASVVLHTGYKLFLVRAYAAGDMSQVYPIARGTAPFIVAIVTWLLIGETLGETGYVGLITICTGLVALALFGQKSVTASGQAVGFALCTACFIAAYSTVDGIGARNAGSVHGYAFLLFVLEALPMIPIAISRRGFQAVIRPAAGWGPAITSALLCLLAFWAVIWAMTEAPIAAVAALRETSVIFGVAISALFLREGSFKTRAPATAIVAAGAVLLQL